MHNSILEEIFEKNKKDSSEEIDWYISYIE